MLRPFCFAALVAATTAAAASAQRSTPTPDARQPSDRPPLPQAVGKERASAPVAVTYAAPVIVNFSAEEIGNGLFVLTGGVADENPSGLVVRFTGSVPTIDGMSAVVGDSGLFTLVVQVNTDGSDCGCITASTIDYEELESNRPYVFINPTPPPGGP